MGREREIEEVTLLLDSVRLLTLTGAGGVGKTRLSVEAGAHLLATGTYPDGVWFVELAALADPALVPQAVASALGVREQSEQGLLDTLLAYVAPRKLLLILDNCEHLLEACASLAGKLLEASPGLRILASSRQPLGIAGEMAWQVPALSLPDLQHLPTLESLTGYEAIRLFVERARFKRPGFALTEQNAPHIARLCHDLDGMPLAIELAAARTSVLTVEQIVARLGQRFRLLTEGSTAGLPRHQTLRAAIDWSYELLPPAEQALMRGLSVFAGSFPLEAVVEVTGLGADEFEAIALLGRLVDKSLVLMEERGGEARYRMLETIREYASEKLEEAGEAAELRRRHLGWYLQLAERAYGYLQGPDQKTWLDRLALEHDNMRAALRTVEDEQVEPDTALALANALWRFWHLRGYLGEGRRRLEDVLELAAGVRSALKARVLAEAGAFAYEQGDYPRAESLYRESLDIFREVDDPTGLARTLNLIGILLSNRGDYNEATSMLEESLALYEELGLEGGAATCLNNLGNIAVAQGDYPRASEHYERALNIMRKLKDTAKIAIALNNLGRVERARGNYDRAQAFHEESLAIKRELGDRLGIASSLMHLAEVASCKAGYDTARALYTDAIRISREAGNQEMVGFSLRGLADLEYYTGSHPASMAAAEECLLISRQGGMTDLIAEALNSAGAAAHALGDYRRAIDSFCESLEISRGLKTTAAIVRSLLGLSDLFSAYGKMREAAQLLAAGEMILETTGHRRHPAEQAAYERLLAKARAAMGRLEWDEAWARGSSLRSEEAIDIALQARDLKGRPTEKAETAKTSRYPAGLTRREVDVLRLLAQGLSDAQIAERLYLSPHTVHAHLHSIYGKLDITTRSAAVRFAVNHQLA